MPALPAATVTCATRATDATTALTAPPAAARPWYAAVRARDARFDGRFFVGVVSTGIYCRPVCRVRTPLERNCRYFDHAAAAEAAGFRPCLRCRPELAPGLSLIDSPASLAAEASRRLDAAVADGEDPYLPDLARRLGVSDRHLRRIFQERFGVAPLQYLATRRLLQAKQLLTDSPLSITEVAHACGFGSLRRFQAAFRTHYRLSPLQLRQSSDVPRRAPQPIDIRLGYRPPYDHAAMLAFLRLRAIPGVEAVDEHGYHRSVRLMHRGQCHTGWLSMAFDSDRHELRVRASPSIVPAMTAWLPKVRSAFDLDADPAVIDDALSGMPGPARAGVRLPGSLDGFETAVRVILGQQVTVAAARTLATRLVDTFGEPLDAPLLPHVQRLFPTPAVLAGAPAQAIGQLGIVRQRVGAIQALAAAVDQGQLRLDPFAKLPQTMETLLALPGIGAWSAQLIALRALGWPDAFAPSDIGVLKALGSRDVRAAQARAEAWRPWRAYALIRLWQGLED